MNAPNKTTMLQIINEKGVPFNVRLVSHGDKYGRDDCLTHDRAEPMIELYDARSQGAPSKRRPRGQFVSRYYLSTFMGAQGRGIDLDGGVADWQIAAENVAEVIAWLKVA